MSGALKFNFGDGVIVTIGQTADTKRGYIKLNGNMFFINTENKTIATLATDKNFALNLYQSSDKINSVIAFRNYEYGNSGLIRTISYSQFANNDTNSPWVFTGTYIASNGWTFKSGGVYFETSTYWRTNNIINATIWPNGNIRIYNNGNLAVHKLDQNATTNYYTSYQYNGRTTFSNIGGEDPRYRITGYNNFVNSIESYGGITIKTENQATGALTRLRRDGIYIENASDPNSNDRTVIERTRFLQYAGSNERFTVNSGRLDIFNNHHIFLHSGLPNTTESYREFSYDAISGYNNAPLNITSDVRIEANAPNFMLLHRGARTLQVIMALSYCRIARVYMAVAVMQKITLILLIKRKTYMYRPRKPRPAIVNAMNWPQYLTFSKLFIMFWNRQESRALVQ